MKLKILVYTGPGTKSTDVLLNSIKRFLRSSLPCDSPCFEIKQTNWQDLKSAETFECTKLIVLPGGRDLPYVEHIKTDALDNIRAFVEKGGSFLGICAGAYFACTRVLFDEGGPLEVVGPRELALLNVSGVGPVYPGFTYNSTRGSRVVPLACNDNEFLRLPPNSFAYFNGGGEFVPNKRIEDEVLATNKRLNDGEFATNKRIEDEVLTANKCLNDGEFATNGHISGGESMHFNDFHTLAYYKDFQQQQQQQQQHEYQKQKRAIVASKRGSGKVILSFVHPEMSHKFLQSTDYNDEQWSDLLEHENIQYNLFESIMKHLLL